MKKIIIAAPLIFLALLISQAVFIVDETKQVILLQFGAYVRTVKEPGLNWMIPFVQAVTEYEKRLLRYDAAPAEFLTRDKKALVVDSYARYRISNPRKFFETVRDLPRANARIDAIIASVLRETVASHDQSDIITEKREPIMEEVGQEVRKKSREFGVEVIDVRIKRTDFPREIAESIHARMRAERNRISKRFRSEGAEEELKIKGETDKERAIIIAEAKKQSEILRGEGDAVAIRIFADALRQDPEFYAFLRSLQTYRESMGEDTSVILTTDSPLFRYLEGPGRPKR
ncbi:MAG: protease modulator HflC [SAR324 cluster bacterium]|nr:protease modulator HflC [SAR324 cluster bacterium]